MAVSKKKFTTEQTTGFGERSTQSGGRFFHKDGKPNVVRKGLKFFDRFSWYHTMISMTRLKFWLWLVIPYVIVNAFFALVYYTIGVQNLNGIEKGSAWNNISRLSSLAFKHLLRLATDMSVPPVF